jgi:hypothetical protein
MRLPRKDGTALTDAIPLCYYSHVQSEGTLPVATLAGRDFARETTSSTDE